MGNSLSTEAFCTCFGAHRGYRPEDADSFGEGIAKMQETARLTSAPQTAKAATTFPPLTSPSLCATAAGSGMPVASAARDRAHTGSDNGVREPDEEPDVEEFKQPLKELQSVLQTLQMKRSPTPPTPFSPSPQRPQITSGFNLMSPYSVLMRHRMTDA
eukprot:TRINITY_DN113298_c0_g1_i1.p1 TRINITY_DN113298_c0_g1~~TRINITY_DN113298_c0_g1_i1.p1  ORF type:complete len:158 (-),score=35.64 TRINITY_DN113298_c0_g1_i1:137-610(-)